jgi:hypothetical protein
VVPRDLSCVEKPIQSRTQLPKSRPTPKKPRLGHRAWSRWPVPPRRRIQRRRPRPARQGRRRPGPAPRRRSSTPAPDPAAPHPPRSTPPQPRLGRAPPDPGDVLCNASLSLRYPRLPVILYSSFFRTTGNPGDVFLVRSSVGPWGRSNI